MERPGAEWNIFWCAGQVDPCELPLMKPHQRVNKFPKANCLTLKANLWTNYLRMRRRFGADAPRTVELWRRIMSVAVARKPDHETT